MPAKIKELQKNQITMTKEQAERMIKLLENIDYTLRNINNDEQFGNIGTTLKDINQKLFEFYYTQSITVQSEKPNMRI